MEDSHTLAPAAPDAAVGVGSCADWVPPSGTGQEENSASSTSSTLARAALAVGRDNGRRSHSSGDGTCASPANGSRPFGKWRTDASGSRANEVPTRHVPRLKSSVTTSSRPIRSGAGGQLPKRARKTLDTGHNTVDERRLHSRIIGHRWAMPRKLRVQGRALVSNSSGIRRSP